jgi:hypothetical protein
LFASSSIDLDLRIITILSIVVFSANCLRAYALAKNASGLTVTLLFHRESLVPQWQSSGKCIEVVTNGLSDKQFGFNTKVMFPKHQHEGDQDSPMIEHLIVATIRPQHLN